MSSSNFHHKYFDWVNLLEKNVDLIRSELMDLIEKGVESNWFAAHPHYVKSENGDVSWYTFEFYFFGIQQRSNCRQCPETTVLLQQIPELVTAQFSLLKPHTHVQPHKGFTRMVWRNHLPLIVPKGGLCKIKVEDETHAWEEGRVVTFDDSKLHEAWNQSDEVRAVLMIDVANDAFGYSAKEICTYKLDKVDDPFLLSIAPRTKWLEWLNQGFFDEPE